ncbi:hypothetical protein CPSG_06499 [Coccidioides posadasii str. Silveira]|uniref:Uncharacterized protein n=1 Tax=Coccidioides posadasii (strain RMSCC 757 / Silveira) TaxID=443226 RepID=E9D9J7_COCPS|nr:hypothetical protein CPSG_06499 [Coccidioides posadasii str. Silveira]
MPFIGVPRMDKEAPSFTSLVCRTSFISVPAGDSSASVRYVPPASSSAHCCVTGAYLSWRYTATKGSLLVSDLNGSQYRRNPGSKGWPTCIANFKSQER